MDASAGTETTNTMSTTDPRKGIGAAADAYLTAAHPSITASLTADAILTREAADAFAKAAAACADGRLGDADMHTELAHGILRAILAAALTEEE